MKQICQFQQHLHFTIANARVITLNELFHWKFYTLWHFVRHLFCAKEKSRTTTMQHIDKQILCILYARNSIYIATYIYTARPTTLLMTKFIPVIIFYTLLHIAGLWKMREAYVHFTYINTNTTNTNVHSWTNICSFCFSIPNISECYVGYREERNNVLHVHVYSNATHKTKPSNSHFKFFFWKMIDFRKLSKNMFSFPYFFFYFGKINLKKRKKKSRIVRFIYWVCFAFLLNIDKFQVALGIYFETIIESIETESIKTVT